MFKEAADSPYGANMMAYAGIATFMRQPASRQLKEVDLAVVGIPFDSGASSYRSGTRFGPRKLRDVSSVLWGFHHPHGIAPLQHLQLVDYGDIAVESGDIKATMQIIEEEIGRILATNTQVVSLGGDHSITLPLLRAHAARFGPLAVLHFDAHSDVEPGVMGHGSVFRYALEEGLIDPTAYLQVGIRGPMYYPDDIEVAEKHGAQVLTIDACFEMGIPALIAAIRERIGRRPLYISLDVDVVDPAYAPGTGTPEIGGFSSYQMQQLLRGLHGLNFVGFDIVEVSPPFDHADITAILGVNFIFEYLSLLALNRRNQ